jgi:hypothetical protein
MCCGKGREQLQRTSPQAQELRTDSGSVSAVLFEYVGKTALTVLSPVTGRRYRFERPGDRVLVDPRDRPSLRAFPNLREIK